MSKEKFLIHTWMMSSNCSLFLMIHIVISYYA